jgi:hypothetical protein
MEFSDVSRSQGLANFHSPSAKLQLYSRVVSSDEEILYLTNNFTPPRERDTSIHVEMQKLNIGVILNKGRWGECRASVVSIYAGTRATCSDRAETGKQTPPELDDTVEEKSSRIIEDHVTFFYLLAVSF